MCRTDNGAHFKRCLDDYVERTMGCVLPWNAVNSVRAFATRRPCDTVDDARNFENVSTSTFVTASLEKIKSMTGENRSQYY